MATLSLAMGVVLLVLLKMDGYAALCLKAPDLSVLKEASLPLVEMESSSLLLRRHAMMETLFLATDVLMRAWSRQGGNAPGKSERGRYA